MSLERTATSSFSNAAISNAKIGIYLAVLQLVFTLGWTVYVVYLPQLATKVGIPISAVIIVLLIDQAIFTVTDTLMGIAADRMTSVVGRLSRIVVSVTIISCLAFLSLPFIADLGADAKLAFGALIVTWAVTSSALRAPPFALFGKFAAKPSIPILASLAMLGYGLAAAAAPYLGVLLRHKDARIPFVVSALVLLFTAFGMSWLERQVREGAVAPAQRPAITMPKLSRTLVLVSVAGLIILAIGVQLHFNLNSSKLFLRFAKQPDLEWLLPVYWIGFSVAVLPASFITKRMGGLLVIGCAALMGAAALLATEFATGLDSMIVMQFVAGAAWGCILMSAFATAIALGSKGAEGTVIGLMFSSIAIATVTRMAAQAGDITKNSAYDSFLQWTPMVCWSLAGVAIAIIA